MGGPDHRGERRGLLAGGGVRGLAPLWERGMALVGVGVPGDLGWPAWCRVLAMVPANEYTRKTSVGSGRDRHKAPKKDKGGKAGDIMLARQMDR